jgi:hypothetical protein
MEKGDFAMEKEVYGSEEQENLDEEIAQWNEQEEEEHKDYIAMDFSLETPEERKALVEKILEENPEPNE